MHPATSRALVVRDRPSRSKIGEPADLNEPLPEDGCRLCVRSQ
jgi:hypothetical protein